MNKQLTYTAGDSYGALMLTGKSFISEMYARQRRSVECLCQCGKIFYSLLESIKAGLVKSCGCLKKESHIKHGFAKRGANDPLYRSWASMIQRCYNENTDGFENWGGRGIIVCEEWLNDFRLFKDWAIKNGWKKKLQIDRINNNGNYEPENCRWSTFPIQSRNKRTNHLLTAFGETKCVMDWSTDNRCSVNEATIRYRIKQKWDAEKAISEPSKHKKWPDLGSLGVQT